MVKIEKSVLELQNSSFSKLTFSFVGFKYVWGVPTWYIRIWDFHLWVWNMCGESPHEFLTFHIFVCGFDICVASPHMKYSNLRFLFVGLKFVWRVPTWHFEVSLFHTWQSNLCSDPLSSINVEQCESNADFWKECIISSWFPFQLSVEDLQTQFFSKRI